MLNEQERLELIQDLIDRLLYLPETKMILFIRGLKLLHDKFNIDLVIVNGVRTYKTKGGDTSEKTVIIQ